MKYLDKFKLSKKTAYVVGGSGTIGTEICIALSDAGAKIVNIDIKENKYLKSKKNIHFFNFDIKKIKNSENCLKKIKTKFGSPNIFINCSYPFTEEWPKSSFKDVSLKSLNQNISLHLNSYIWLARLTAEMMKKEKIFGSIIQLASTYGIVGQDPELYKGTNINENAIYSAIKGGIINQTKQMAAYYGQFGIRINSLSPGGIKGKIAGKKNSQSNKFIKRYSARTPLKRMGDPSDIAPAVIFLSSSASNYITGSNIVIDGGWTVI